MVVPPRSTAATTRRAAMRAVDCPCGLTLTGDDDDELFVLGRRHADEHHRDENIPDDFIRDHIRQNARDSAA
jgi:predicted small metal-binding protein